MTGHRDEGLMRGSGRTAIQDTVELALAQRGMAYEDGGSVLLLPHGSARVMIEFVEATPPTATVRSSVLTGVELNGEDAELALLRRLNELNTSLRFGKFYLGSDGSSIAVEYEILASHVQSEELMHALAVVANLADDHDDPLRDQLGHGHRGIDPGHELDLTRSPPGD